MRALSIRQPFAELILRGMKTVEYRSRSTSIVGERFWIYASRKWAVGGGQWAGKKWGVKQADNIIVPAEGVPPWMVELAKGLRLFPHELPTGVIVGSAVIENVSQRADGLFEWKLAGVERAAHLKKPARHPQPVWFRPF